MKVHQMPLVPDRLLLERPQPKPSDGARPAAVFADLVALRVNPREKDSRRPPQRERRDQDEEDDAQPPAPPATRINLLT